MVSAEDLEGILTLRRDPRAPRGVAAVLSLVVPGLGQAFLGQWLRGFRLFCGSAALLFGCGLCNLAVAYDAWSIGSQLRDHDLPTDASSRTLMVFGVLWSALGSVVRGIGDSLASAGGPGPLLALPWTLYDALTGRSR